MDLRDLYQDIILDHGRHPRNHGPMARPSHLAHGHNPLCGDRVTIYLDVADDVVRDVRFDGHGCAISTASASLMTEVLSGKSISDAALLFENFHHAVTGLACTALPDGLAEDAERLAPLAGVKSYPARVKCATLAWHTFHAALKGSPIATPVKTE